MDRSPKAYLDRLVVGSFMTITSAMSPNLAKYSFRLSEKRINDSSYILFSKEGTIGRTNSDFRRVLSPNKHL